MNIPEDLVRNAERWRDMQASPVSRTEEEVSTPTRTSTHSQSLVNRRKQKSVQTLQNSGLITDVNVLYNKKCF